MPSNSQEQKPHYMDSTSADGLMALSGTRDILKDETSEIPRNAHLVKAPYGLKRKNTSITRTFVVFKSGPSDPMIPDIRLQTKNALIRSAIYTNNLALGRPLSIYAQTKNADLILKIHTLPAVEPSIDVRTSTKNGRNKIFLPPDFKGLLEVSTKNGRCRLSKQLKKVAVLLPSRHEKRIEDDDSFELVSAAEYSDGDSLPPLSNGVGVEYEVNGGGPSHAAIDTKNGNVFVGFVRNENDEDVGCNTMCSVM